MSSASARLSQVAGQMKPSGRPALLERRPDDVVVTAALRTAITKGGKGGFKDTAGADLLHGAFVNLIERSGIDPSLVEDISVGCVLAPGGGATEFRAAALAAGFPNTTGVKSLNRQCSSGLQACAEIANAIRTGMIEIGVGAGVESMSTQYGPAAVTEFSELLENHEAAAECKVSMGVLSEQMAKDKGVSRKDQDKFAADSYRKAIEAQKKGLFDQEIVPLKVKWEDPKTEEVKEITVARDDGVREVTAESLGKIRAAFAKDGSIHAGNASQVSDGAAAVLLMKRSTAERLGQKILGKFVQASIVGVPPLLMGIGPWKAIPVALEKAGITKDDVDIYEINEAFASQALWCVNELGLPIEKINPKGGAIAFGHPLGCTGARQVSTLLYELKRTGKQVGVTSMCVGTGKSLSPTTTLVGPLLLTSLWAWVWLPYGLPSRYRDGDYLRMYWNLCLIDCKCIPSKFWHLLAKWGPKSNTNALGATDKHIIFRGSSSVLYPHPTLQLLRRWSLARGRRIIQRMEPS